MLKDWTQCYRGLFEDKIRHEGLRIIWKDNMISNQYSVQYNYSRSVIEVIKSRRMRCDSRRQNRNAFGFLVRKPQGKSPLGRPGYWRADNVKMNLNPLKPELNPICYLLALLGAHHFLHVSRIRVKLLTFRLLMSYIYGAPILDVCRSHTTTQHSR